MASPSAIAHYLLKDVNRAVREFDLIQPNDRIAVGVSGGKDSCTLLDLLLRGVNIPPQPESSAAVKAPDSFVSSDSRKLPYEVVAVHIDGTGVGLPDQRPILEPWLKELGVAYDIAPLEVSEREKLPMNCFRCSLNRRKALFFAADRLGCNKVALGHHADDAAVTTLMSLLYKGQLETLEPRLNFFNGRFILIRPLIYLSATEISRYARACGWQAMDAELECPHAGKTRRAQVERFLASHDAKEMQQIRANLWHGVHNE